jgi:hypothetical protein
MRTMKLYFDNEEIALLKGSYKLGYTDEEALNKSEAGTVIREMIREGVLKISVSTYADDEWAQKFRAYKALDSLTVKYYDPSTLDFEEFEGYITNFACELYKGDVDDSENYANKTFWTVSFDIASY